MANGASQHSAPLEVSRETRRRPKRRWWLAVLGGTLLALPIGWLLSYAAPLLFLIGLFFFVLLGLVLGALMYRLAAPGRPYSTSSVLLGTTVVVAACWGVSLVNEVGEVPLDLSQKVVRSTRDIGARTAEDYRSEVEDRIRDYFRDRYPPGGFLGTVRWIITSGEVASGDIPGLNRILRRDQRGRGWAVRVVLSIAMLAFGIGSQTIALRKCENQARVPSIPLD